MSLVSVRALVLRATPYGESSRIVRVLTDEWGLVSGVARGARRRNKRGGGGDWIPFSSGELTLRYRAGKELQSFRAYTPEQHRLELAAPPLRFAGASAFVEVLARAAPESSGLGLGSFAERRLDQLGGALEPDIGACVLTALWELVRQLGFEPILDQCVRCQRTLDVDEVARMDFELGGVICGPCEEHAVALGPRLGPGARSQLVGFLSGASEGTEYLAAHLRLLTDFIQYHVGEGRPLRSFDFLLGVAT